MELAANLCLRHGRRPGEDGRWEKNQGTTSLQVLIK